MKISYREINSLSWINDTWLAPYCGWIVKLKEYKNGKIKMYMNGGVYDVTGKRFSSNGWEYGIKKLLGKPIKDKKKIKEAMKNIL